MTDAGWKRILRIMDEAFEDYLTGLITLGKRVVVDLQCKLNDGTVPDHARRGAGSRTGPRTKRG